MSVFGAGPDSGAAGALVDPWRAPRLPQRVAKEVQLLEDQLGASVTVLVGGESLSAIFEPPGVGPVDVQIDLATGWPLKAPRVTCNTSKAASYHVAAKMSEMRDRWAPSIMLADLLKTIFTPIDALEMELLNTFETRLAQAGHA